MFNFSRQEKRLLLFFLFSFIVGLGVSFYRQSSAGYSLLKYRQQQDELLHRFKLQSSPGGGIATATATNITTHYQAQKAKLIAKLDLNQASVDELQTLERIGPALAQKIVLFREQRGAFNSVEDLLLINGIGVKTLARIRDQVYIRP